MNSLPLPLPLRDDIRILVVDDSRVQLRILKDLLSGRGYHVLSATDGKEALEVARANNPTLVISDIIMPVMNGFDFCQTFKGDPQLRHIPVILLTSLADPSDIVLGLMAQADYYLTKPYSAEYLLSTIGNILQHPPLVTDEPGLEPLVINMGETEYRIPAGRRQMLTLLLSTYGNSVQQNLVLTQAQSELRALNEQLQEQSRQILEQQEKLEEANLQLHSLATHDGLTKLKNHRAFKEKLNEELDRTARYRQPLSLLLLDVDYFKLYNDSYGHPAGDDVLVTMGRLLHENCRAADFAARYGGEEFAMLLPNTDRRWALMLAERLRLAIQEEHWPLRPITASFGVTTVLFTTGDEDAAQMVKAADSALYFAKHHGRNCVAHSEDLPPTK